MADLKLHHAELEATLKLALLRDRSAEDNVFITRDGDMPDWIRFNDLELQLEQRRALHALHSAETALEEAS